MFGKIGLKKEFGSMKRLLFFTLSLIATSVFGFEIEDRKKFWVKTAPTQMRAHVSFSTQKSSQIVVKSALDLLLKEVKEKHQICRGGEYFVYPMSEYDPSSKKMLRKGYTGAINFECAFTDTTPYDKFLEFVNKNVKSKEESINVYPLRWELSQEESESALDALKLRAIEYAQKRALELSKTARSVCEPKKIAFEPEYIEHRAYASPKMALTSAPATEAPTPEAKEISVSAFLSFDCKK